jgi:beta-glucosidase
MMRPAVISKLLDLLDGLYVELGVADDVLIEQVLQRGDCEATLPFELPSSMDAVRQQRPDLPCDSRNPLFEIGTNYRRLPPAADS